jgi:single-stranded DNA-binding protein
MCQGRMQMDKWEKDGEKRMAWKMVADGYNGVMIFPKAGVAAASESKPTVTVEHEEFNDDLPF